MANENKVELIGYYGSDEVIACSAWTSTSRVLTDEKRQRIPALIDMLWSSGHETPFEKATIHFLVDTDIASHIHLIKHRLFSINGESARYKELKEDKYYLPNDWVGIAADTDALKIDKPEKDTWLELLDQYTKVGNRLYHDCVQQLEPVLGRKRAKESARFFKAYNSQIQADVMCNMRTFANFLRLRRSDKAQLEIRDIADKMLKIMEQLDGNPFEHTLATWRKNGIIQDPN